VLFNLCAASADLRSRVLTCRRRQAATPRTFHPPSWTPAIKGYFLEQPAMLLSPMSALQRITDSSQTSSWVRKVPIPDLSASSAKQST